MNDGYLVVPSAGMDVFLGLGHLEQVRKAEKKFVAMARAFWAVMKFLCPPHPGATGLAYDGHPEIYYHGALRAIPPDESGIITTWRLGPCHWC